MFFFRIPDPDPTMASESLRTIILGVKIFQFCADFLKYISVHMGVGRTHEGRTYKGHIHEGRIHEGRTCEGRIHKKSYS